MHCPVGCRVVSFPLRSEEWQRSIDSGTAHACALLAFPLGSAGAIPRSPRPGDAAIQPQGVGDSTWREENRKTHYSSSFAPLQCLLGVTRPSGRRRATPTDHSCTFFFCRPPRTLFTLHHHFADTLLELYLHHSVLSPGVIRNTPPCFWFYDNTSIFHHVLFLGAVLWIFGFPPAR